MAGGKAFDQSQAAEIDRLLRAAREQTGLRFSVWVGQASDSTRGYSRRLHAALGREAPIAVLIAVDPVARRLEIVTGAEARRRLDDRTCAQVAMSMVSSLNDGDLAGGITTGITMLTERARHQAHHPELEA